MDNSRPDIAKAEGCCAKTRICNSCTMRENNCPSAERWNYIHRRYQQKHELSHCANMKPLDSDVLPNMLSGRSLHKRSRMDALMLTTAFLLSNCCLSHGNMMRPRLDETHNNKARSQRNLRPEYYGPLIEDASSVLGRSVSFSMSLSFDVSESVKSVGLGEKSLASEYLSYLHNKTSSESAPFNGTFLPIQYKLNYTNITDSPTPSLQDFSIPAIDNTNTPLITPTSAPKSESPSDAPTDPPSDEPTDSPSKEPTDPPSKDPTLSPSKDPTISPSEDPTISPSKEPTEEPTGSPSEEPTPEPTPSPSRSPVTETPTSSPSAAPTKRPTKNPTQEPTESPSYSPTENPTTRPPSRSPVEGPQPTDSPSISFAPTDNPTRKPTPSPTTYQPTRSPTWIPSESPTPKPTKDPTKAPTNRPTVPIQSFSVPTSMVFYYSDRFKGEVLQTWKDVTSRRIEDFTRVEIKASGEQAVDLIVDLDVVSQKPINKAVDKANLRGLSSENAGIAASRFQDRSLQSQTPLLVNYTVQIQFRSFQDDWDSTEFVSSGFATNSLQRSYVYRLKSFDANNFESINSFQMEVDGTLVTTDPVPPKPEPENDNNSTLIWAIIGAAGGTLATAFLIFTAIYVRKRNKLKYSSKSSMDGDGAFPDVAVSTKEETQPQASSYFGTIESREGELDDVSTLGDPYFGEAVNAVMDRDDTVAESMISAEQDMYVYGVGRPRLDTGTTSSRMDTTISGKSGNKMMFNDDTTLEDIYKTPQMTQVYDQEDDNSQRITVVAPSGKLGIVIDNPGGDIPIVHAIKESSALNGRIKVGDFLLSVDERDCRGMSAVAVSKLISSRSENPSRTFVILRGSAGGLD